MKTFEAIVNVDRQPMKVQVTAFSSAQAKKLMENMYGKVCSAPRAVSK